jgi:hypothetical protein
MAALAWIYVALGTPLALVIARLAFILFTPTHLGVEMSGGETDMLQFQRRDERPRARRRRWRLTIERD